MDEQARIAALNDHYFKGTLTFDQFVLGATLAAVGYLAQTGKYTVIGWNQGTFTLVPLILLGLAAWLGFKRIEMAIHTVKMNGQYLELCHRNPRYDFSEQLNDVKRLGDRSGTYYRWRNRFIAVGLVSHVGLQVLFQYPIF